MLRPPALRRTPVLASVLALGLGVGLGLTGCASEGDGGAEPTPSVDSTVAESSSSPTDEPTSRFTEPGTELEVGQPATVKWHPNQKLRGELRITVTSLERTTFKETFRHWVLTDQVRGSSPYFVRAKVKNVGKTDLGGFKAPIYGLDAEDYPYEPAGFDRDFAPCQSAELPEPFKAGQSASVCLVVLVRDRGDLVGATYWPDQDLPPITWTGPVSDFGEKKAGDAKKPDAKKPGAKKPGAKKKPR